jgi:hypothetical protein
MFPIIRGGTSPLSLALADIQAEPFFAIFPEPSTSDTAGVLMDMTVRTPIILSTMQLEETR